MYTLTVFGRSTFKPIYNYKINQIKNNLSVSPTRIEYQDVWHKECNCQRKVVVGLFGMSNKVSFPIEAELTSTNEGVECRLIKNPGYDHARVQKDLDLQYFECYIDEASPEVNRISNITYSLNIFALDHRDVSVEKRYSSKDFVEKLGL